MVVAPGSLSQRRAVARILTALKQRDPRGIRSIVCEARGINRSFPSLGRSSPAERGFTGPSFWLREVHARAFENLLDHCSSLRGTYKRSFPGTTRSGNVSLPDASCRSGLLE